MGQDEMTYMGVRSSPRDVHFIFGMCMYVCFFHGHVGRLDQGVRGYIFVIGVYETHWFVAVHAVQSLSDVN